MNKTVLALDTAIQHTGWCVMDAKGNKLDWGSIDTDKEIPTSSRIREVVQQTVDLVVKYNVSDLVLEDVFNKFDVSVTKKLSRLQGALEHQWMFRTGRPCIRLWTVTARSLVGLPTQSQKVEVLLWVDASERFLKPEERTTFVGAVKALNYQKKHGAIKKTEHKNQSKILANNVAKVSGITEDMGDAYVLAKAFLQLRGEQLVKYQD